MKTLRFYTMIYDADCPLCSAYTNAFISSKILDKDGRVPYQQVGGSFCPGMDAERAKNEIALIDRVTGEVKYGYDSLVFVLGSRFSWIKKANEFRPVRWFMKRLYSFISYNRKVIIPPSRTQSDVRWYHLASPGKTSPRYDCTPSFNLKYRWAYIIFTWLITSIVLVNYSRLFGGLIPATNFIREFLICGGQILFQFASVSLVMKVKRMDYLGNMMTVSLMGALLLLPALMIGNILSGIPVEVFLVYFMCVVGLMLYEHLRRMKILELGWWPSASWVLYRLLVLMTII